MSGFGSLRSERRREGLVKEQLFWPELLGDARIGDFAPSIPEFSVAVALED